MHCKARCTVWDPAKGALPLLLGCPSSRPAQPPLACLSHPGVQASEEFYAVAWSADTITGAPLLLLAGKNGLLLVVNPLTGALETCFEGHGLAINDIAVHPTRPQFVATASRDQSLRLWNLRTRWAGRGEWQLPCMARRVLAS